MSAHPPADVEPDAKRARVALAPEDEGVRKGATPPPGDGEGAEEEEEVVEVSIDGDGDGDGDSNGVGGITEAMQAEEQRLHDEREERDKEWREEQTKAFKSELALEGKKKKTAIEQRVKRLNDLLERSIVYSEFLSSKLKNPSAAGAPPDTATTANAGAGNTDGIVAADVARLPQPAAITGGVMRDYQLVGVHWLTGLYENGLNGILGDEMGLGKTVQTIGFLAFLRERGTYGPFLIVGPLSTINNWHAEFQKWAPSIPSLVYHGSKEERARLRSQHMRFPNSSTFPVVITSYEIVLRDTKELRRLQWKFLVVDEGHRLKNLNCRLIKELKAMNTGNRLLLSGTPLQNNLTELWALLNFLLPDIFDDLESFQSWFDFSVADDGGEAHIMQREEEEKVVTKLHLILKPFLLRRLKADVDLSIPDKYEYVLYTDLTQEQKKMYVQVLDRELHSEQGQAVRLNNVLMQLRKVCNHPFLFDWPKDAGGEDVVDERIVSSSGKMVLLDRIVNKLREEGGHRILLFSQMTSQLDILEDYCSLRGLTSERLDGSVSNADRIAAMARFNNGEADVFLLSTRAGGLGVNLVAADTCIIYDSDWNPHADLQAQDRCHRIGQKHTVLVFRLTTADTVEEQVLKAAKDKLRLEQLVISKGKYKMVGEKTNRHEALKRKELQTLLAYNPAKAALGKDGDKAISDAELSLVLSRAAKATAAGHGFANVDAVTSTFDAARPGADG